MTSKALQAKRTKHKKQRMTEIGRFVRDECQLSWRYITPHAEMAKAYAAWCKKKGIKPLPFMLFSRWFCELMPAVVVSRNWEPRIGKSPRIVRHYVGIAIRYRPQRLRKGHPPVAPTDARTSAHSEPSSR